MTVARSLLIGVTLISPCSGQHAHGASTTKAWEWAGTFDTPESSLLWTAQSKNYAYADPGMKIVILPAPNSTEGQLHYLEGEAGHSFSTTCVAVAEGGTMAAAEDTCYQLTFDNIKTISTFTINTASTPAVAIFAEHFPTEFERDQHYLKNASGYDVEPVAQEPAPSPPAAVVTADKQWGAAIGASFLVCICTLIGVAFLAPNIAKLGAENPINLGVSTNAFAAGGLLAAAFYLMFFEATHLIVPISIKEASQTAWWGSAIILGYITAFIIEILVFMVAGNSATPTVTATKDLNATVTKDPEAGTDAPAGKMTNKQMRVLSGVLLGDFMHNLVDGIIIGVAFSGCGLTMGWSITASTVYHELAQEVSDYLVLTDPRQGALKPLTALGFNFVSGMSVVLGAIIILSVDTIESQTEGLLLAYGGGIYIQIACTEAMPRVHDLAQTTGHRLLAFLFFCIGCVAIGLVLLDHEHCVPAAPGGAPAPAAMPTERA